METISSTLNPHDPQYRMKRRRQIDELLTLSPQQLERNWLHMASQQPTKEERDEQRELTKQVLGGILATGVGDQLVRKSILDSTGGGSSGGSVLVRQDLEAPVYSLFVKAFPAFDRIPHKQANGLVHI